MSGTAVGPKIDGGQNINIIVYSCVCSLSKKVVVVVFFLGGRGICPSFFRRPWSKAPLPWRSYNKEIQSSRIHKYWKGNSTLYWTILVVEFLAWGYKIQNIFAFYKLKFFIRFVDIFWNVMLAILQNLGLVLQNKLFLYLN